MNYSIFLFLFSSRLEFDSEFGSPGMSRVTGDGDGTVNIRSLQGCGLWENSVEQGSHAIIRHELDGAEHYNILNDARAINYILHLLTGNANYVAAPKTVYDQPQTELNAKIKNLKFRLL